MGMGEIDFEIEYDQAEEENYITSWNLWVQLKAGMICNMQGKLLDRE